MPNSPRQSYRWVNRLSTLQKRRYDNFASVARGHFTREPYKIFSPFEFAALGRFPFCTQTRCVCGSSRVCRKTAAGSGRYSRVNGAVEIRLAWRVGLFPRKRIMGSFGIPGRTARWQHQGSSGRSQRSPKIPEISFSKAVQLDTAGRNPKPDTAAL